MDSDKFRKPNYTVEPTYATHDVHGNELDEEQHEYLMNHRPRFDSFTKTNWKSADSRDTWREMLRRAAEAKSMAEWKSVADDRTDRVAAIIHVDHNTRDKWLERVGEHGLHYRQIRYSRPYEGFSHKFLPAEENDPERISYSVIAENEDVADKMYEAETQMQGAERHRTVGNMLGFPDCCLDHFVDVWLDRERIDPIYEITCNTNSVEKIDGSPHELRVVDPEPWANVMWRYFGWSFITHLPCSWDCSKSHDIAQFRGEIMSENGYREAANSLYSWLNLPHVWSGLHGLSRVANEHILGSSQTSAYWNKKRVVWGEEHPDESVVDDLPTKEDED